MSYKYNTPYTPKEILNLLPELPRYFQMWVDSNAYGNGVRQKIWFGNLKDIISSNLCDQHDIDGVNYAFFESWTDGTYKGTFTLVDPCEGKKPQLLEVGDYVEVLESARECGGSRTWNDEKHQAIGKTYEILQIADCYSGISYVLSIEATSCYMFPHYCLRKVEKPETKQTVTLELTKEQLKKIKEILK